MHSINWRFRLLFLTCSRGLIGTYRPRPIRAGRATSLHDEPTRPTGGLHCSVLFSTTFPENSRTRKLVDEFVALQRRAYIFCCFKFALDESLKLCLAHAFQIRLGRALVNRL